MNTKKTEDNKINAAMMIAMAAATPGLVGRKLCGKIASWSGSTTGRSWFSYA